MGVYYYSPVGAVLMGPVRGRAKMTRTRVPSPSTILRVGTLAAVREEEGEWVEIALPVPRGRIKVIGICYQVETATPGSTYIAQVRLVMTREPDVAHVVYDDARHLTSTVPGCVVRDLSVDVQGAIALDLKMAFGSAAGQYPGRSDLSRGRGRLTTRLAESSR